MKKLSIILIVAVVFSIVGCGNKKTIQGVEYDTYGLLNQDEWKSSEVKYRIIVGNLIWGIILIETIFAPIYFFGFSLFEPVGVKEKEAI